MAQPHDSVLYLGNKDPIREGRRVRTGLDFECAEKPPGRNLSLDWTFFLAWGLGETFSRLTAEQRVTFQSFGGSQRVSKLMDSGEGEGKEYFVRVHGSVRYIGRVKKRRKKNPLA